VATKNNYMNLPELAHVVKKMGVDKWSVSNYYFITNRAMGANRAFFRKTGIGADVWADKIGPDPYFSTYETAALRRSLNQAKKIADNVIQDFCDLSSLEAFYSPMFPSNNSSCSFPYTELMLRCTGEMELCQNFKLGHIKNKSVQDAWLGTNRARFIELFEKKKLFPACFRCCALNAKFLAQTEKVR